MSELLTRIQDTTQPLEEANLAGDKLTQAQLAVRDRTITQLRELKSALEARIAALSEERNNRTTPAERIRVINGMIAQLDLLKTTMDQRIAALTPPPGPGLGDRALETVTSIPGTIMNAPQNLTNRMLESPALQWGVLGAVVYTGYRFLLKKPLQALGSMWGGGQKEEKKKEENNATEHVDTTGMSWWLKALIAAGVLTVGSVAVGAMAGGSTVRRES